MEAPQCGGASGVFPLGVLSRMQLFVQEADHTQLLICASSAVLVLLLFLAVLERRFKLVTDLKMGIDFLFLLIPLVLAKRIPGRKQKAFHTMWDEAVKRWPNKVAVEYIDEDRKLTFKEIEERANQMARLLQKHGFAKRDIGAIFMSNKPEMIIMELAITKLGGVAALVNYNLRKDALSHCVKVAAAKVLIFDADLAPAVEEIAGKHAGVVLLSTGEGGKELSMGTWLDGEAAKQPTTCPKVELGDIKQTDPAFLVYTSGTSGLPKAALIKHQRLFVSSVAFARQFNLRHSDRIFCVLPLYHSAGGNICLGLSIHLGATMLLRSKFSARNFFKDATERGATVMQYIGEICRYLSVSPASEYDRKHKIRVAFGNGLRPDVWPEFTSRFNIRQIGEFYGSTEGNVIFFNYWRKGEPMGAIGKHGPINQFWFGWHTVKFDQDKEEPIRDAKGRCIICKDGEAGELIAEIRGFQDFPGYYGNKEATNKKILRDVFKKGDAYFRTGDLVMRDRRCYLHFVDRIGDTYRWRGENVSTSEVGMALSKWQELDECVVVGAAVPGADGRAGLAAVTLREGVDRLDLQGLLEVARTSLPAYAVPLFVRVCAAKLDSTGTFKLQKGTYRSEGIDPSAVGGDPLYYLDPKEKRYLPLTPDVYKKLEQGAIKL